MLRLQVLESMPCGWGPHSHKSFLILVDGDLHVVGLLGSRRAAPLGDLCFQQLREPFHNLGIIRLHVLIFSDVGREVIELNGGQP